MASDRERPLTAALDPLQERLLVARAQQGDRAAFNVLVQSFERRVLYFIRRFERDEHRAIDLLQEVWLTVFQKLGRLRSPAAFRSWVYQIAHDRAVTQVRRDRQAAVAVGLEDAAVASVDEFLRHELADSVHRALGRLSPEHRAVLVLRFLEDLSLHEIADVLREPLGTVKSRLHYAKEALRRELTEEQP